MQKQQVALQVVIVETCIVAIVMVMVMVVIMIPYRRMSGLLCLNLWLVTD